MTRSIADDFIERLLALLESRGLGTRTGVSLTLLQATHRAPPVRVPLAELAQGGVFELFLDRRRTSVLLDLSRFDEGLRSEAELREALAYVESQLAPLTQGASLAHEVARAPHSVGSRYRLQLDANHERLTINPRLREQTLGPTRGRGRAGLRVTKTREGGRRLRLALPDGQPARFGSARWVQLNLLEALSRAFAAHHGSDPQLRARVARARGVLERASYDPFETRDILRVSAEGTDEPIFLVLSTSRERGMVSICSDVHVMRFDDPEGRSQSVRKPVIYFWPQTELALEIQVAPRGPFVAQYPKQNAGAGRWSLIASPEGMLRDPSSGRQYAYLFWESEGHGFELDPERAHCVAAGEAATFLERVADAYALVPRERTDFVSYWLPALERNPYSLVQLLTPEAYAEHVQLQVRPQPDTIIRLFMLIQRARGPASVGAPALAQHQRAGFSVVEWGGVDLDEVRVPELELSVRAQPNRRR